MMKLYLYPHMFMAFLAASILCWATSCKNVNTKSESEASWEWDTGGNRTEVSGIITNFNDYPLVGIEVQTETDSGLMMTTTNNDGLFVIRTGERYLLSIKADKYLLNKRIRCAEGLKFEIKLPLQPNNVGE